MQPGPRLSIAIITYNRAQYLERTLGYIRASPLAACTIEVIDNASTDDTDKVVRQAQLNWPTLSYLKHPYNIGVIGNILFALYHAKAVYLWLACDDDYISAEGWSDVFEQMDSGVPDVIRLGWWCAAETSGKLLAKRDLASIDPGFLNSLSFCPNSIMKVELIRKHFAACTIFGSYLYPHLAPHIKSSGDSIYYTSKLQLITRDDHAGIGRAYVPTFLLWCFVLAWIADKQLREKAFRFHFTRNACFQPFNLACSELARARLEAVELPFNARACYHMLLATCPPSVRLRIGPTYVVCLMPRWILRLIYHISRRRPFEDHSEASAGRELLL